MSKTRQQRQSEQVRGQILEIARRVISEDGVEALSIRRITKEMDYSAGIIYHYFKDKEEIIMCILKEEYLKILAAIKPPDPSLPPDEAIRAAFTGYIRSALTAPAEYKAIMFSSTPQILNFTSVLEKGASEKRPALMQLVTTLKKGIAEGIFAPCDAELTAQSLWSAMFGLLARLIVERDVTTGQQSRLIDQQINILLKGLQL